MNARVPLITMKAQPLILPEHRDAFYGGKWHKPTSGRSADAINPGTGETLGPVALPVRISTTLSWARHSFVQHSAS